MPNWRCPHCRASQPESARCWVCGRSTTSCSTCSHFRRSIAVNRGGTCGLRPGAGLIRGDELRGCWRPLSVAGHNGRAVEPRIDPLGPAFPFPGSIWAFEAEV